MKIIVQNKKARHDFFIEETYEAGIKLLGSEIKSIRLGKVQINDAFVTIKDGEAFVHNMHIAKYDFSSIFNHEETRPRKLLLHKKEIIKLFSKIKEQGYTIIPLKLYLKEGLCKLEIGLAKGKKDYDKRETLKERDQQMRMKKILKNR
ncbi:SsrA-binding protein SmpB [Mariniplasma sp. M4Ah]|uniref:SsrA-binding protein n=2 Tax=Peloplasma aerotolerans TaxID=3044389 RepID=A0AAW6U324_9MOLU|nr:SsrA-binding protein SmpB [Mariniplasma sp. M4Ah]MDI6452295.1 SsrA-binding protein SmpB [Mariniplasma sp. M4Ah]